MNLARTIAGACLFVITSLILNSCHKDESRANQPVQNIFLNKDVMEMPDCQTTSLSDGPFLQPSYSFIRQWAELSKFKGYYRNNKYFKAQAWNDETNFYVHVSCAGYQYDQALEGQGKDKYWALEGPTTDNYPFNEVVITLNGTDYSFSMDGPSTPDITETSTDYTHAFPLPQGWQACTPYVYSIRLDGEGQQVWIGEPGCQQVLTYYLYSNLF